MKRKFLSVGLITALMVPSIASARTSQAELRGDRQDIRYEQRDVRQAHRYGTAREVHREKRDLRQAKKEYRSDRRDYRADRHYAAPRATFRYHRFNAGTRLNSTYYAPRYRVAYNSRWGVPRAGRNLTYVRHYNDLLLVNVRSGVVVRAYQNFYW